MAYLGINMSASSGNTSCAAAFATSPAHDASYICLLVLPPHTQVTTRRPLTTPRAAWAR